ncbi:aminopeptidase [Betaproteobacteria bacterium]|nr:aminopeptidase [Betaproteobacteria bacterium]
MFGSLLLSSCSSIKYNYGLIDNHLNIIKNAQPIDVILKDKATNQELKTKLLLVNKIKDFAYSELHFRKTKSYSTYSDILRKAVVWNVVAVKENSFDLKEWCYIFMGCFNYRGFYEKKEAEEYAKDLIEFEDLEVAILPVPAYSTLGWSDLFGGDPVLNTFIWNAEIDLVKLLIHEMTHQQVFVKNDTLFNESFASFVEDAGSLQWIKKNGDTNDLILYEEEKRQRDKVGKLLRSSREALESLYNQNLKKKETALLKEKIFKNLRRSLIEVKDGRGISKGYNDWVFQINSAWLAAFSLYDRYKPFFKYVFIKSNSDWIAFYKEVRRLKKIKKGERTKIIENFLKQQ